MSLFNYPAYLLMILVKTASHGCWWGRDVSMEWVRPWPWDGSDECISFWSAHAQHFLSFHILDWNAMKKTGEQTAIGVPAMDPQQWGVLPPAPLHSRGFGCVCGNLELGQLWGCSPILKPYDHFRAWQAEDRGRSPWKVSTASFVVAPFLLDFSQTANAAAAAAATGTVCASGGHCNWDLVALLQLISAFVTAICSLEVSGRRALLNLNSFTKRRCRKEDFYMEIFLLTVAPG